MGLQVHSTLVPGENGSSMDSGGEPSRQLFLNVGAVR